MPRDIFGRPSSSFSPLRSITSLGREESQEPRERFPQHDLYQKLTNGMTPPELRGMLDHPSLTHIELRIGRDIKKSTEERPRPLEEVIPDQPPTGKRMALIAGPEGVNLDIEFREGVYIKPDPPRASTSYTNVPYGFGRDDRDEI